MEDRKPILVVEDDAAIRQLIATILRDAGHTVVECGSSEEALSLMERITPILVTLDLAMPSMDGLGFLELLKTPAGQTRIPVLVVTAAPEQLRIQLTLEGYHTLGKPFHVEDLLLAVEHALAERRAVA